MKTKNILISWTRPPLRGTADGIAVEAVANQPDVPQWPEAPGSRLFGGEMRCASAATGLDPWPTTPQG
jgi:hypothetical protein